MPRRRFTLLDAMILVAGLAVGVFVLRVWRMIPDFHDLKDGWTLYYLGVTYIEIFAFYLVPAVVLVRLRRPRPAWPDVVRQPGFVACVAAPLGAFNYATIFAFRSFFPHTDLWKSLFGVVSVEATSNMNVAPAVLLAWIVLALTGGWRAEASWVDRLGRGLGLVMILLYGFDIVRGYVTILSRSP